jgi:hypothetical protein
MKELSQPVYFINGHWAVTSYGIEILQGTYDIRAETLRDTRGDDLPCWPRHIHEKGHEYYGHPRVFMDAFLVAIAVHRVHATPGRKAPFRKDWYEVLCNRYPVFCYGDHMVKSPEPAVAEWTDETGFAIAGFPDAASIPPRSATNYWSSIPLPAGVTVEKSGQALTAPARRRAA